VAFPVVLSCRSSWPMDEALLLLVSFDTRRHPPGYSSENQTAEPLSVRHALDCHSCYPTNPAWDKSRIAQLAL
jgi:hypothetical protein